MKMQPSDEMVGAYGDSSYGLRLDTLIRIRWLAIAGQTAALLFTAFALEYELPLAGALALVSASAWLNVFLRARHAASTRLSGPHAAVLLGYDILQLAALLYLTGGMQNPFAVLLVVPVIVSATAHSFRQIVPLGALAILAATVLAFRHLPLPAPPGEPVSLPILVIAGMWVAVCSTLVFTAVYAYLVAHEARKLSAALAATELVLQREQHLSALDGLAAAAAHELGTPLATIALVSREMMRELPGTSPLAEDAKLLRDQAERCRGILRKLSSLSDDPESHLARMPLSSMMEEVAAPHRDFGVSISIGPGVRPDEPVLRRNPGVLYGLGNLLENAVDFAVSKVEFSARWDGRQISIVIGDDGPGYPADLLERIGEPYMTSRRREREATGGGLGLGLFIAKTLLERSGAQLVFFNATGGGARIEVHWPRRLVDISLAAGSVSEA
jgi:two-component system sensor histidine kinase RegB